MQWAAVDGIEARVRQLGRFAPSVVVDGGRLSVRQELAKAVDSLDAGNYSAATGVTMTAAVPVVSPL